ncbi:MAG: thioredoxin family protein [Thermoguttaceae bacterium]|nr:thioredoxin family protein [Thermoguttaceae bacterium]MDW8036919.1 thioredoxin family protein [Thermoguttaceae bacterium]
MRSLKLCAVLLAGLAVVGLGLSCQAAETKLKIGDKAPDFKDLPGVDGKKHSLSDYADAKIVVVVFTCNHCPVAQAYEDRIIQFQKDYKDKGVQVIAINSNSPKIVPADSFEKMVERAKEKGFNFPYVVDETQEVAHAYGATVTPHFFVLCQERKVAYMGAMDDNNNPDKVKEHWLRDAVDALLAGKTPPKQVTQQRGCTIKWEKK